MSPTGVLAYLGLGSNQGDRLAELRRAVAGLAALPGVAVTAASGVWETEHVGVGVQAPYLNACVEVRTELSPLGLLEALKGLEAAAGRRPDGHRQPRPIDLDILLYADLVCAGPQLRVPHPELRRRAFVLEPLAQIAARVACPDSGETIGDACAKIRRKGGPWVRPHPGGGLRDPGPASEQGGPGCCPGATSSLKA
jgi:2-amino-4-hydroxy-6-hydroxymethyldihydropteridine diphosphokinase